MIDISVMIITIKPNLQNQKTSNAKFAAHVTPLTLDAILTREVSHGTAQSQRTD